MNTSDLKQLLQSCAQIDPPSRDLIADCQCTPEQEERVLRIAQRILDEIQDIRHELLEILESIEANESYEG